MACGYHHVLPEIVAVSARPSGLHAPGQCPVDGRPTPDLSLVWSGWESAGDQAQVPFTDEVDTLAAALQTEVTRPPSPIIGSRGRRPVVQAEAHQTLRTPAPAAESHTRAACKRMLNDFITVANCRTAPSTSPRHHDRRTWTSPGSHRAPFSQGPDAATGTQPNGNRAATTANDTRIITNRRQRGYIYPEKSKIFKTGRVMRLNRAAATIATVAIASAAVVSGCGATHTGGVSVTRPAQHLASAPPDQHAPGQRSARRPPSALPRSTRRWRGWDRLAGRLR